MKLLFIMVALACINVNALTLNQFLGDKVKTDQIFPQAAEKSRPVFKIKTCIKFNKDSEKYWENRETLVLKINKLGKSAYKVNQINFMKKLENMWFASKKTYSLPFSNQKSFSITACPKDYAKMKDSDVQRMMESLK